MEKFNSKFAEMLYRHGDPDDQVGSSSEGVGWAGLYMMEMPDTPLVAVILVEHTDGQVEAFYYDSFDNMRTSWLTFERTLDVAAPNLAEDVVVWDLGDAGCLITTPNDLDDMLPLKAVFMPDYEAAVNFIGEFLAYATGTEDKEFWRFSDGRYYLTELNPE